MRQALEKAAMGPLQRMALQARGARRTRLARGLEWAHPALTTTSPRPTRLLALGTPLGRCVPMPPILQIAPMGRSAWHSALHSVRRMARDLASLV